MFKTTKRKQRKYLRTINEFQQMQDIKKKQKNRPYFYM